MHDGFVNMTELAIRYLAQEAQRSDLGPLRFALRIKREIKGIATVWENPAMVLANAARSYVIQTDMIADRYFRALRDDVRGYKQPPAWVERAGKNKLDSLGQLIANMNPPSAQRVSSSLEFAVVNYYRLVRNDIVHARPSGAKSPATHRKLLAECEQAIRKAFPGFCAPNELDALSFDDFRVFTRALDRLVPPINDAMDLTPQDVVRFMLATPDTRNKLRRRRSDKPRLLRFVRGYCHDNHGMSTADTKTVIGLVDDFLATDPNWKERKRLRRRRPR